MWANAHQLIASSGHGTKFQLWSNVLILWHRLMAVTAAPLTPTWVHVASCLASWLCDFDRCFLSDSALPKWWTHRLASHLKLCFTSQLAASLLTTPRNRNVAPLTTCCQIISETVIHHCPNSTVSNAKQNMRSSSESSVASVSCSTASLPSWHTWSWQAPVSELRS